MQSRHLKAVPASFLSQSMAKILQRHQLPRAMHSLQETNVMPDEPRFKLIKLKSPRGASPPFPPEIRSIQAAKNFVSAYIHAPKRSTLRWRLAIGALNGGEGSYLNAQLVLRNALDEEGWLDD
jgi:hypothetical protein